MVLYRQLLEEDNHEILPLIYEESISCKIPHFNLNIATYKNPCLKNAGLSSNSISNACKQPRQQNHSYQLFYSK